MKTVLLLALGLSLSACIPVSIPHTSVNAPRFAGRVVDAANRRPVAGAVVAVGNLSDSAATTDSAGRYLTGISRSWHLVGLYGYDEGLMMRFPPPKRPEGNLVITRDGYLSQQVPVSLQGFPKPIGANYIPTTSVPVVQLQRASE